MIVSSCVDWAQRLRRASFRGVTFLVDLEDQSGGRRVVVHEYPMRDEPFLEDMGEAARGFRVSAYLSSVTLEADLAALVEASTRRGAATLVLPLHGAVQAVCLSVRTAHERDRAGYAAIDLEFMRDGARPAPVVAGLLARQVVSGVEALAAVLSSAANARAQVARVAGFARAAGADTFAAAAVAAQEVTSRTPMESAGAALAVARLRDMEQAAGRFAADPGACATATAGAFSAMSEAAGPDAAFSMMAELAGFEAALPPLTTASRRAQAANIEIAGAVVRAAASAELARAAVSRTYATRSAAVAARTATGAVMAAALDAAGPALGEAAHAGLADLRGLAAEHLSRTVADLAPVIEIEAAVSMPACAWAWRLYGDTARAGEIVDRNGLPHASFVPARFEAAAR